MAQPPIALQPKEYLVIRVISLPPDRVRTIPNPNAPDSKTVYALVKVDDVPADLPLDPDPRVPKPTNPVAKKITASLGSWDGRFHLLNRGITISAADLDYDNKEQKLLLDIPEDDARYGIIDGGHTYHSIVQTMQTNDTTTNGDRADQYVRLEIMVGVEDHLVDIAQARNFSLKVHQFSLENKRGSFKWLVEALGDKRTVVKFSENDPQPVLVLDILQWLTCVNPDRWESDQHPVEAYKNAGKCLEWSLDAQDKWHYRNFSPIVLEVCRLYDYIRYRWAELYNRPDESGRRGRFGRTTEATVRKRGLQRVTTYHFLDQRGKYPIEKGLAFPVLSGMRALVEHGSDGNFTFRADPFAFFDRHGKKLISSVLTASDTRNNDPHNVGRDASVYAAVYSEVRRWWLEDELAARQGSSQ